MKKTLAYLLASSLLWGSDVGFYNPALTTMLADKHSVQIEYEQKNFPKYHFSSATETSTAALNKQKYVNAYYVSKDLNGGRIVASRKRESSGVDANWGGTTSIKSASTFLFQKDQTQLGYAKKLGKFSLFLGMQEISKKALTIAYPIGNPFMNEASGKAYGGLFGLSYSFKKYLFMTVNYSEQVDITLKGSNYISNAYNGTAQADIAQPAKLNTNIFLYTSKDSLWIAGIAKTFWSSYKELDINYGDATTETNYGPASPQNWKDIMIYSFGHQHTWGKFKLLGIVAQGEDPAPNSTRTFSTPAGAFKAYILKSEYALNEDISLSLKLKQVAFEDSYSSLRSGTFSGGEINLMTFGVKFTF